MWCKCVVLMLLLLSIDDEPHVPDVVSLIDAIQFFVRHPALQLLIQQVNDIRAQLAAQGSAKMDSVPTLTADDITQEMAPYIAKAEAGRYRSVPQLMRDLKYVLDGRVHVAFQKLFTSFSTTVIAAAAADPTVQGQHKEQFKFWKERSVFLLQNIHAFLDDDLEECVRLE